MRRIRVLSFPRKSGRSPERHHGTGAGNPPPQYEEGIGKTMRRSLDRQEWLDNIISGEYEKYYQEMYGGRVWAGAY